MASRLRHASLDEDHHVLRLGAREHFSAIRLFEKTGIEFQDFEVVPVQTSAEYWATVQT